MKKSGGFTYLGLAAALAACYNELKAFTDEEKQILSDDFAERYDGKADEFIDFISDPAVAAPGTYQKTWDYIEKDKNSLNRHSNMHLIFT